MEIMTKINDGFLLAQKDLEMRGSGDIFGDKQSGLPEFKVADPVGDFPTLEAAQKIVAQIFKTDPHLLQSTISRLPLTWRKAGRCSVVWIKTLKGTN